MNAHYATIDEPATPEYVLAVMRDLDRLVPYDNDDPPSFGMTVEKWCDDNDLDLISTQELGHELNDLWAICVSADEWRETLEPGSERCVRDVCELIARHAKRPRMQPARLFGTEDAAAGAFLTVRSFLRKAGRDPKRIRPSTPLMLYMPQLATDLLPALSRLAPGALPDRHERCLVEDLAMWGCLAYPIVAVLGVATQCVPLLHLAMGIGLAEVLLWRVAYPAASRSFEFDGLRTFRDLAEALAR